MRLLKFLLMPAIVLALVFANAAFAQRAPGEDPVKLENKVTFTPMPGGPAAKSTPLDGDPDMPAWLRAKVARFEAKAYSGTVDDGTLQTDSNVTNTTTTQGVRRTCVQEVGSTQAGSATQGSTSGTRSNQQIVVLRGDLINICR
jgi:hypothetical protein